jgi:RNA polymerase sigma factor (sigma-70 family)
MKARPEIEQAFIANNCTQPAGEAVQLREANSWPDSSLIAAVRSDPPDETALDALVKRYWPSLFARCQLLTQNRQKASELAQNAWYRLLRARQTLKPDGDFPGYLWTIATNLWRDSNQPARRAGATPDEHRLLSPNATSLSAAGETVSLGNGLPDSRSLHAEELKLLEIDLDRALARLTPLLCDVLLSRVVIGESCAEIGRRYARTERTVSGWVREAIRRMNQYLEESSTNPSAQPMIQ